MRTTPNTASPILPPATLLPSPHILPWKTPRSRKGLRHTFRQARPWARRQGGHRNHLPRGSRNQPAAGTDEPCCRVWWRMCPTVQVFLACAPHTSELMNYHRRPSQTVYWQTLENHSLLYIVYVLHQRDPKQCQTRGRVCPYCTPYLLSTPGTANYQRHC